MKILVEGKSTMKYKQFDVIELKDANKAIILQAYKNNYLAEIVNTNGVTLDKRILVESEIQTVLYSKKYIR